ncbi:MAG: toxin-antitoxin system YwqK family antitoxin [Flavobacteriales bacterium]
MNAGKIKKVIAVAGLIGGSLVADAQTSQNIIDQNNLKQGHWVYLNRDKKLPGYKPEQKVEEGDYKDNLKEGQWVNYYNNEKIKEQITYQRNLPNGYTVSYYPNGNKKEEGTWKNGNWVGAYKFYHENGQLASEWTYNNMGTRAGEQKYYYESGKLMISGEWVNGKENGAIKEYYENGDLKAEKVYMKGALDAASSKEYERKNPVTKATPVEVKAEVKEEVKAVAEQQPQKFKVGVFDGNGMYQLKDKDGKVAREGLFEKGKLVEGKVFQYNSVGKLIKTMLYKGGKVVEVINHEERGE